MSDAFPVPDGVDGVNVSWEEARAANLANWNERVAIHVENYGIDRLRADADAMSSVAAFDVARLSPHLPGGSLAGLELCHLQCHIGTDTVSLARAGARVTGVDFSRPALDAAAALAQELGVEARWVETDVMEARAAVDAQLGADTRFDVVYTSIGTIGWLADLDTWAAQVAALLRRGGVFYIRDGHPMLYSLDEGRDELVVRYRYFGDGRAQQWDSEATYAGTDKVANTRVYEYPHTIADVVTALLGAGLTVAALHEDPVLPWRFAERMIERPDGEFEWPAHEADLVPCTFTVVATAPAEAR